MTRDEREVSRSPTSYRDWEGGDGSLLRRASVTFYGDDGYATRFNDPDELRTVADEMRDAADWLESQREAEPTDADTEGK